MKKRQLARPFILIVFMFVLVIAGRTTSNKIDMDSFNDYLSDPDKPLIIIALKQGCPDCEAAYLDTEMVEQEIKELAVQTGAANYIEIEKQGDIWKLIDYDCEIDDRKISLVSFGSFDPINDENSEYGSVFQVRINDLVKNAHLTWVPSVIVYQSDGSTSISEWRDSEVGYAGLNGMLSDLNNYNEDETFMIE